MSLTWLTILIVSYGVWLRYFGIVIMVMGMSSNAQLIRYAMQHELV